MCEAEVVDEIRSGDGQDFWAGEWHDQIYVLRGLFCWHLENRIWGGHRVETEMGKWLNAVIPHGQNNGLEGMRRDQSLRALGKWSVRIWWWVRCKTCKKRNEMKSLWSFCEEQVTLNLELNKWVKSRGPLLKWGVPEREGENLAWGKVSCVAGGKGPDLRDTELHPEVCILAPSLALSFVNTRRLGFPFLLERGNVFI